MRPDLDPGAGELGLLAVVAIACWVLWAWMRTRTEP
jgi:hypothetical protein